MRTGRPTLRASSAAWSAIIDGYSSFPPKPPPVSAWTTCVWASSMPEARFSALWT